MKFFKTLSKKIAPIFLPTIGEVRWTGFPCEIVRVRARHAIFPLQWTWSPGIIDCVTSHKNVCTAGVGTAVFKTPQNIFFKNVRRSFPSFPVAMGNNCARGDDSWAWALGNQVLSLTPSHVKFCTDASFIVHPCLRFWVKNAGLWFLELFFRS